MPWSLFLSMSILSRTRRGRFMRSRSSNWVCFHCRRSVRRSPWEPQEVRCSSCGRHCEDIGYKLRLPRRHDESGWRKLEKVVSEGRQARVNRLECVLEGLRERKPNRRVTTRIRELERVLAGHLAQQRNSSQR